MAPRFALYFAPRPETALARFGAGVIGHDIWSGEAVPHADLAIDAEHVRTATEEPRRYGFHATLKAPFHLREGTTEAALERHVAAFAATLAHVSLGQLEVRALSRFLALVPADPPHSLAELAAACVQAFEAFRAPLTDADRARRLAAPLTERQRALLDTWGYPYVLDEFRFHMTLTGALDGSLRPAFERALVERWAAVEEPAVIEGLALAVQPTRDAQFRVKAYFPFMPASAT